VDGDRSPAPLVSLFTPERGNGTGIEATDLDNPRERFDGDTH